MRRALAWVAAAVLGAAVTACAAGGARPTGLGERPKALLIGVDGLRPEQLALAETPVIDGLGGRGGLTLDARNAWTAAEAWNGHSATNWAVLLTGVRPDVSGMTHNGDADHRISDDAWLAARAEPVASFGESLRRIWWELVQPTPPTSLALRAFTPEPMTPTVFGRLRAEHPDDETGCFNTWEGIGLAPGTILGASRSSLDCFFHARDAERSYAERDREVVTAAVEALGGNGRFADADIDLAFVQLSLLDTSNPSEADADERYRASIEEVDELVGELLGAIAARRSRRGERWLVILTADHGARSDAGEHADNADPEVHTIPFVIAADGLLPGSFELDGASLYDVVPTLCEWLDLASDPDLPGRTRLP